MQGDDPGRLHGLVEVGAHGIFDHGAQLFKAFGLGLDDLAEDRGCVAAVRLVAAHFKEDLAHLRKTSLPEQKTITLLVTGPVRLGRTWEVTMLHQLLLLPPSPLLRVYEWLVEGCGIPPIRRETSNGWGTGLWWRGETGLRTSILGIAWLGFWRRSEGGKIGRV